MKIATKDMTDKELEQLFYENFPSMKIWHGKLADFYGFMNGQTFSLNEQNQHVYYATDINRFLQNQKVIYQ